MIELLLVKCRRAVVTALHVAIVFSAYYLAFLLRFNGAIDPHDFQIFTQTLPLVAAIQLLSFIPFRLYQGLWRYVGIQDLKNIITATLASTGACYLLIEWVLGVQGYPRSVYVIDDLLLIVLLGGARLGRRLYHNLGALEAGRRVLIFGAGDAGEMIVRDMKNNPFYDLEPIGFVDDDLRKVRRRIHNVPVLGTRAELQRIMTEQQPDEVLVAIPRAEPATIRQVVSALEPFKVPIKTLPNLRDLMDGKVTVSQIRSLALEDLLERPSISLEPAPLRRLIAGRRVMVTGAGGSIGAELCRQIMRLEPGRLILFERYENSLYAIGNELWGSDGAGRVELAVGDVTDASRVAAVLEQHRPEIIFHAAAHKHVPLMETNPCEAVKNNILGTRIVAEAASRHGVERFILISTDKAVNPSSVMGVTKRVTEFIVQNMAHRSPTCFAAVRFGNVLGSNGSVVPRFLEQIKGGGPVTVTHPEIRRYFMLIPEAVQLVLHAAAMDRTAALYILEMGEQVKVLEVARNLIRLAGFVPDDEIPITFVGLRPGEKLYEELAEPDEEVEGSPGDKILWVRAGRVPEPAFLDRKIAELAALAERDDQDAIIERLCEIVPTFRPTNGGRRAPAGECLPVRPAGAAEMMAAPWPVRAEAAVPPASKLAGLRDTGRAGFPVFSAKPSQGGRGRS